MSKVLLDRAYEGARGKGGGLWEWVKRNYAEAERFLGPGWVVLKEERERIERARRVRVAFTVKRPRTHTIRHLGQNEDVYRAIVNNLLREFNVNWQVYSITYVMIGPDGRPIPWHVYLWRRLKRFFVAPAVKDEIHFYSEMVNIHEPVQNYTKGLMAKASVVIASLGITVKNVRIDTLGATVFDIEKIPDPEPPQPPPEEQESWWDRFFVQPFRGAVEPIVEPLRWVFYVALGILIVYLIVILGLPHKVAREVREIKKQ